MDRSTTATTLERFNATTADELDVFTALSPFGAALTATVCSTCVRITLYDRRKAARPTRWARPASRRRSSSVNRKAPSAELSPQQAVLFDEIRKCRPLAALQPAGQRHQHHLERGVVDHEARGYIMTTI